MLKQLFSLCLILFICNNSSAQTKREKILAKSLATISLQYTKISELDSSDTRYLVYLGFQNAKYQTISDFKSVAFFDTTNLNKFKEDLLSAYKILEKGEKVDMSWTNSNYKLNLYDFSKNIYIVEAEGTEGYTSLTKKQLGDLLIYLFMIDFGKDQLLPQTTIDDILIK